MNSGSNDSLQNEVCWAATDDARSATAVVDRSSIAGGREASLRREAGGKTDKLIVTDCRRP
jgi:hypothetical protein